MSSDQPRDGKGRDNNLSPEINSILLKYGEAMMRLGQMEREVEHLRQQVQVAVPTVQSPNPELTEALQAKEKELKRKDETIASLRLHISTITSQLEKTEERLKAAAMGNYMIYRKRRRKWWQFWRRSSHSRA